MISCVALVVQTWRLVWPESLDLVLIRNRVKFGMAFHHYEVVYVWDEFQDGLQPFWTIFKLVYEGVDIISCVVLFVQTWRQVGLETLDLALIGNRVKFGMDCHHYKVVNVGERFQYGLQLCWTIFNWFMKALSWIFVLP